MACLAYLDDVIIYAPDAMIHIERLAAVFDRVERAGVKFIFDKCNIMQKQRIFLGHYCGRGNFPGHRKDVKIKTMAYPPKVKDVRAFLGLCTYYKSLICGFASLATPLTDLTRKGRLFVWDAKYQFSFEALKSALTSEPIVAMPNDYDPFVLDVDVSVFCISGVWLRSRAVMNVWWPILVVSLPPPK